MSSIVWSGLRQRLFHQFGRVSRLNTLALQRNCIRPFHASMAARDLRLGDVAPDFSCETTAGPIKSFHDWVGKDSWCILFSHPADFTPVCTTELGMVEKLQDEFAKRNVKPIGLSCDGLDSHVSWISDIVETQGLDGKGSANGLSYPIIADSSRKIAETYQMLDQNNINNEGLPLTVRSVFVINGADMKIKLILTYPASTGRNFDEILRVLDSLQLTEYQKVATPVNWTNGEECVIVPSVKDEDAKKMFPKGWKAVKPYLRLTPQPSKL